MRPRSAKEVATYGIIPNEGKNEWDDSIFTNLVNTTLFIQNVFNREFNETLLETTYPPDINALRDNIIWKTGSENFAKNLAELNKTEVYECWSCYSKSFLNKELFTCYELEDEGFQCVTCFNSFYLHDQIGLATCICNKETFVLDALNPQRGHEYNGKCLRCDFSYFAYKCEHCETFFIDIDKKRIVEFDGKIYCSDGCKPEISFEDKNLPSW